MTIRRRAEGGRSIRESNAEKRWLSDAEEKVVVDYAIELANRAFPLSHRRLKEHVDEIIHAHHGDQVHQGNKATFPEGGVGEKSTGSEPNNKGRIFRALQKDC